MSAPEKKPEAPPAAPPDGKKDTSASGKEKSGDRKKEKVEKKVHEVPRFRKVQTFLDNRTPKIAYENFDENFDLKVAIEFYNEKDPKNRNLPLFTAASERLTKWDSLQLFNQDPGVFKLQLKELMYSHKEELEEAGENPDEVQKNLQKAYDKYQPLRAYCKRIVLTQHDLEEGMREQKVKVGTEWNEDLASVVDGAKDHFNEMSGTEKLVVAGGLLFAASMLLNSDNPHVENFRNNLFTCAKIGGLLYVANTGFKLFTGKTFLSTVADTSKSHLTGSSERWNKAFKVPQEHPEWGEALAKSTVYWNNEDAMSLYDRYQWALNHRTDEVEILSVDEKDMTRKQNFMALHTFFKRYPMTPEKERRYRSERPPMTWLQMMAEALVIDEKIKIESDVDQLKEKVGNWYLKALAVGEITAEKGWDKKGEPWRWAKALYRKTFGYDGDDDKVQAFAEKSVPVEVTSTDKIDEYIQSRVVNDKSAQSYIKAFHEGKRPYTDLNVQSYNGPPDTDHIYIIAHSKTKPGEKDAPLKAVKAARKAAVAYVLKLYPEIPKKDVDRFIGDGGFAAFCGDVADTSIGIRIPKRETPDFNLRMAGIVTKPEAKDAFGPDDSIEKMVTEKPYVGQQIQIRSLFSSEQKPALAELYEKLTEKYRPLGKSKKDIEAMIFNPENKDVEDVVQGMMTKDKTLQQKLGERIEDLKNNEGKVHDIEEDVRSSLKLDSAGKETFMDKKVKARHYVLSLALLRDPAAMEKCGYVPDSTNDADRNTIAKLLKWYKNLLQEAADEANK